MSETVGWGEVIRKPNGSAWWKRPNGYLGPEPPLAGRPGGASLSDGPEDRELAEAFRARLLAELLPRGALQMVVAERIVLGMWKSLRGAVGAAARPEWCVVRWIGGQPGEPVDLVYERCEFESAEEVAAVASMSPVEVARYEASLSRQLRRDMEQLGAMQGRVIGAGAAMAAAATGAKATRRTSRTRP